LGGRNSQSTSADITVSPLSSRRQNPSLSLYQCRPAKIISTYPTFDCPKQDLIGHLDLRILGQDVLGEHLDLVQNLGIFFLVEVLI
jgi:hypothetical protein